jgi:putative endonuclease
LSFASVRLPARNVSLLARVMYRALVWKERQRAHFGDPSGRAGGGGGPAHLATGRRGETLAYWYLRDAGYKIVSRNRRSRGGELDLVGWDGPVLAFIEVKTRTSFVAGPPELAVTRSKQKRIIRAAQNYLRRLDRKSVTYRFDITSVAWDPQAGFQVRLIKDAFKD